jgi:hypothetical protein
MSESLEEHTPHEVTVTLVHTGSGAPERCEIEPPRSSASRIKALCPSPPHMNVGIIVVTFVAGLAGAACFDFRTPQLAASWVLWAMSIIVLLYFLFASDPPQKWLPDYTHIGLYVTTVWFLCIAVALTWLGPTEDEAASFMCVVFALTALAASVFAVSYGTHEPAPYEGVSEEVE